MDPCRERELVRLANLSFLKMYPGRHLDSCELVPKTSLPCTSPHSTPNRSKGLPQYVKLAFERYHQSIRSMTTLR